MKEEMLHNEDEKKEKKKKTLQYNIVEYDYIIAIFIFQHKCHLHLRIASISKMACLA